MDLTLKNRLVAVAKHLWLNKFAHNVLNLSIWFSLICGGALIPGLIGSSAFVEMIRMVQTGGSFAGVYRGTGTDVFGECVLWLIVGLDAKESFSRSFKASVVEEICPQCFESFKRCKKKQPQQKQTLAFKHHTLINLCENNNIFWQKWKKDNFRLRTYQDCKKGKTCKIL